MGEYIYVLGLGMSGVHHLTEEVKTALRRSDLIFVVHPYDIVVNELNKQYSEVISLANEYREGEARNKIYKRIANQVLQKHRNTDAQVALGVYGHPLFGVTPTAHLQNRSDEDVEIVVRPGISSLDSLFVDLDLDPFRTGFQLFEVNDLLVHGRQLNPNVPALLFQIGTVESELYSSRPHRPERFSNIRNYLEQFYPKDHKIALCRTAMLPFETKEVRKFELSQFESNAHLIEDSQTLYLPPTKNTKEENKEFSEKLTSKSHLNSITERDTH